MLTLLKTLIFLLYYIPCKRYDWARIRTLIKEHWNIPHNHPRINEYTIAYISYCCRKRNNDLYLYRYRYIYFHQGGIHTKFFQLVNDIRCNITDNFKVNRYFWTKIS